MGTATASSRRDVMPRGHRLSTARLDRAEVGARIDIDMEDPRVAMALVKADARMWAWEITMPGGEPSVSPKATMTADAIDYYFMKHGFAHVLTGHVAEAASLPTTACRRCGGTGMVPQYRHVDGGRCYDCGGDGVRRGRR